MFKISPTLFQKKSNLENENYSISSEEKIKNRKKLKNPKFLILLEEEKLNLNKKKKREINCLNENNISSNGRWTMEEHNKFIEGIIKFGSDWKKIEKYLTSRTSTQARSHAQKFLVKLKNLEFLKKKNIDLNLSWSKAIQLIKNSLSEDDLKKVLINASCNNRYKEKKKNIKYHNWNKNENDVNKKNNDNINSCINNVSNNKVNYINYDNDNFFSTTSEYDINNNNNKIEKENNFLNYQIKNNENNDNDDKKDCLEDFMINFNKNSLSSLDFSNDDIDNVYYNK